MKKLLLLTLLIVPILLLSVSAVECSNDDDCRSKVEHPECAACSGGKCIEAWCNLYCEYGAVPGTCGCACEEAPCEPKWKCTKWSRCMDSLRTRTCYDKKECGTDEGKPVEIEECSMVKFIRSFFRRWGSQFRR